MHKLIRTNLITSFLGTGTTTAILDLLNDLPVDAAPVRANRAMLLDCLNRIGLLIRAIQVKRNQLFLALRMRCVQREPKRCGV